MEVLSLTWMGKLRAVAAYSEVEEIITMLP